MRSNTLQEQIPNITLGLAYRGAFGPATGDPMQHNARLKRRFAPDSAEVTT